MLLLKDGFDLSLIETSPDKMFENISLIENRLILSGINHLNKEEKIEWFKSQNKLPTSFVMNEFVINQYDDKYHILNVVSNFLNEFELSARLKQLILTVSDELVSNAFLDAPTDNGVIKNQKDIDFLFGHNNNEIGISIVDYYGSLQVQKLIKHLTQNYTHNEYVPPVDKEGAGLGLLLCLKRNVSVLIEYKENEWTKFTAFFPIVSSYKDYLGHGQMVGLNVKK